MADGKMNKEYCSGCGFEKRDGYCLNPGCNGHRLSLSNLAPKMREAAELDFDQGEFSWGDHRQICSPENVLRILDALERYRQVLVFISDWKVGEDVDSSHFHPDTVLRAREALKKDTKNGN